LDEFEYYNAAFLVNPEGEFVARYRKRNLVMFGEYVPLVRWLPFVKWFTPVEGSFTPGDRPIPFVFTVPAEKPALAEASSDAIPESATTNSNTPTENGIVVRTSPLICFEDIFPALSRESAGDDTAFLVNLTNDGWFGEGAAQWQHAANASFRTIENGLPLVRCTNTGLTCWFDSQGRLRDFLKDAIGTIYGQGFICVQIPLPVPGEKPAPTFYHQRGDWFGWACIGFSALGAIVRIRRFS
jgi:apolipoprotein N-acyltransferase